MKRFFAILAAVGIAVSLCGCEDTEKINELEQKIARLEEENARLSEKSGASEAAASAVSVDEYKQLIETLYEEQNKFMDDLSAMEDKPYEPLAMDLFDPEPGKRFYFSNPDNAKRAEFVRKFIEIKEAQYKKLDIIPPAGYEELHEDFLDHLEFQREFYDKTLAALETYTEETFDEAQRMVGLKNTCLLALNNELMEKGKALGGNYQYVVQKFLNLI